MGTGTKKGTRMSNKTRIAAAMALALGVLAAPAWAIPPSVSVVTGPLVDPSTAYTNYYAPLGTTLTPGALNSATAAPEIKALARALGGGAGNGATPSRLSVDDFASQVFDYVRTNINPEFRFGLGKGARGAVVDQSGTPFDQAELMVKILREGGVAANYKLGTIKLDATQFGKWTGLVYNLNELNQAFSVNGKAACTLLADGGIPAIVNNQASCANVTGDLTTVTMMHVWVEVNGKLYDPSYKEHKLKAGLDLPTKMGCVSAGTSTCGSGARDKLTGTGSGAQSGNYGTGMTAVPYVYALNEGQLNTRLSDYAKSLATAINNELPPYAPLESVIGGAVANPNFSPTVGTTLPYPTPNSFVTWTGEIPDAFRTTLRVQLLGLDRTLYADEAYGKDLFVHTFGPLDTWTRSTKLFADNVQIGSTATFAANVNTQDIVTLNVNHPYAGDAAGSVALNGTLGDEGQALYGGEDIRDSSRNYVYTNDGFTSSINDAWTNTITVVWSLGNTGPGYQSLITQKPKRLVGNACCTGYPFRESHRGNVATYLVQAQAGNAIVAGASKTALNQHHTLGLVYATYRFDSVSAQMNIVSMLSATSNTADVSSRSAAFETASLVNASLEGSVIQQGEDGWESYTGPALIKRANDAGQRFLRVTSSNWTTASTQLTNGGYDSTRRSNIQWFTNNGFQVVVPRNASPGSVSISGGTVVMGPSAEIAIGADKMAITVGEKLKGTASVAAEEPLKATLESVKQGEYSLRNRNAFALDSIEGSVTLKPSPDLIVGNGGFPRSLSFTRTYSSSSPSTIGCSTWFGPDYASALLCQFGGEGAFQSRLPGGWHHNLEMSAEWANSGLEGLGVTSGLRASTAIADIYTAYDAVKGVSATNRLNSSLTASMAAYHLNSSLMKNSFTVHLPDGPRVFAKLPDGTFDSPINEPSAQVVSNLTRTPPFMIGSASVIYNYVDTTLTYKSAKGDEVTFIPGTGFSGVAGNPYLVMGPKFTVKEWKAPDGTKATFSYTDTIDAQRGTYRKRLDTVTNNLGRTLTIGYEPDPSFLGFIKTVTDGTRTVTFNVGYQAYDSMACPVMDWFSSESWSMPECPDSFSVTGTDGGVTTYTYAPDADSPDPAVTRGPAGVIRKWSTPSSSAPYLTLKYDELWHVRQSTDPLGRSTMLYSASVGEEDERFGETVDATGASSRAYADKNGNHTIDIDPLGRETRHEYSDARYVAKSTYPEGNTESFTYDVRGNRLSTVRTPKSGSGLTPITTSATYMEAATLRTCSNLKICNQLATETDGKNNVISYAYLSSTGQLQRITGPAVTAQAGGISGSSQKDLCYTTLSSTSFLVANIDKVKSTENRVIAYGYNPADHYNLSTGTVDPTATFVPPTTAGGACTPSTKSGAKNFSTGITYDAVGNVQSIDGPRPGVADTMTYQFDQSRRVTGILDPLGARTRYCYDADGLAVGAFRARTAGLSDPNATTALTTGLCPSSFNSAQWLGETRTYYPTGDLLAVIDANGYQTIHAYDAVGRERVIQDPNGRQTATVYDAAGQQVAVWKGGSNWLTGTGTATAPSANAPTTATSWNAANYATLKYAQFVRIDYTLNGKKKLVEDANNNQTEYVYDGHDRELFTFFPDPATGNRCTVASPATPASTPACSGGQTYEKQTYDANGNRLTLRTRRNDTITSTFDAADRNDTRAVTGSPALATTVFGYNLMGEILSQSSPQSGTIPAHSVTYDYDPAGRKSYEENLLNGVYRKVSYQYDEANNRTRTIWPDGYFVSYSYDAVNRLEYARENSDTTNELAFYKYDALARRTDLRFAGQSTNRINYTFEPDSQLDVLTHFMSGTTVTLDHGHNESGQLNNIAANDDFYLPSTVTSTPIAIPVAYTPDKLNRYGDLTIGSTLTTPGYDLNGNLLSWGPAGALQTYTYDAENRLRTANVTNGTNNKYDYDTLGRRISKDVGGVLTYYLLDGDEEIAEYNSAGTILRRYITGPGVDDRVARQENSSTPTPTLTYYRVNHQGSVIATTNPNGTIAQQLAYDAYGNLTSHQSAATTGEPFRFTGRRYDPETSLYYYRARYYSSQLGRFLQVDPVGYKDDYNLYAYVKGDPLNAVDPMGEDDWRVLYGEPGLGAHNVGSNFKRAAETAAAELREQGHTVTVTEVGTVQEINEAINSGPEVTGGVKMFMHGGPAALYPGEGEGADTNVTPDNINQISGDNLGPNAKIDINACYAGASGLSLPGDPEVDSIAQTFADQTGVEVTASTEGMSFTGEKGKYVGGEGAQPPAKGPLYMEPANPSARQTFEPRQKK